MWKIGYNHYHNRKYAQKWRSGHEKSASNWYCNFPSVGNTDTCRKSE
jgi:hypothetical protein